MFLKVFKAEMLRISSGSSFHSLARIISETFGPIATKFYLKHHWGGGKAALGFEQDQIETLVSMATDSSLRVIMGKTLKNLLF